MFIAPAELSILIDALEFSTDVYEDSGRTIQDSPSEHLTYLKEKALIKKAKDFRTALTK